MHFPYKTKHKATNKQTNKKIDKQKPINKKGYYFLVVYVSELFVDLPLLLSSLTLLFFFGPISENIC